MDTTKDGQKERNLESSSSSSKEENREHEENSERSTIASDNSSLGPVTPEKKSGPSWKHNQELSFKNIKVVLENAKLAMEKTIEMEKRKLSKMIGAKDSLRK